MTYITFSSFGIYNIGALNTDKTVKIILTKMSKLSFELSKYLRIFKVTELKSN